jgi:hypothetical protein
VESKKQLLARLERAVVVSQCQHGWKGSWSKKTVSAWLKRGVVKRVSFSRAGKNVGVGLSLNL